MNTDLSFDQRETMKQLAQFMHIEIARRSPIVASLVRKGLAKATLLDDRERDNRGRRLVKLELTEKGFYLAIERGWRERDARGTPFELLPDPVGYYAVISPGPLMVVRLPLAGIPGNRSAAPKWRSVLAALTPIMKEHGLRQRDISALDPISHPDGQLENVGEKLLSERRAFHEICHGAYASGAGLEKFHLYDWDGVKFVHVRGPRQS